MKKSKTIVSSLLASALLFGAVAPANLNVKAAAENDEKIEELGSQETLELLELQYELQKHDITAEDIVFGIQEGLPQNDILVDTPQSFANPSTEQVSPYGLKTEAAKVAAKQMIKNIQRIGSIAWDRTVREYVNKLPISDSAKKTLKKYLGYQMVMQVLDVVIGFSGTIEEGISNQLQNIGCPAWIADLVARALVALLL
ncbi:hypothetical protein FC756_09625 [Lysinibacillus mangiferihumi]|uniref:Uncharacterized protein n=1 Tax=Lysinibacillus mangiferihumi TaxID=1130819 RepID=A0A4U2Z5M8_9BACI|nr:hypothetical protein [Lysinibacillus mangiferihumi]TKI69115.1 hypothetical protein FC756_09625 [Lysinibacillus mangiferihumi]